MANDGGIVAALVILIGGLALGVIGACSLYVAATTASARHLLHILSSVSNLGNAVVHALLVVYLSFADTEKLTQLGVQDADSVGGPLFLLLVNGGFGMYTLYSGWPLPAFCWNTFVAFMGSLIPIVWPLFIAEGLANWPYILIFLWLGIYAFESMAFFATFALLFLPKDGGKEKTT